VDDLRVRTISWNHTYSLLTIAIGNKCYTYHLVGEFQYEKFRTLLKYNQGRALAYLKKVGKLMEKKGGG